ncbi:hypothetical protein [Amycolatopsis lexingtonensis]|uniref:hypothetical protein n=1 Tax=Amycolatopsis lexingtonensis TaxID=218822 RepID=UPI003F6E9C7B
MILHRHRKRLEELAKREAAGESLWTASFDEKVRTKIAHAFSDFSSGSIIDTATIARGLILREEGLFFLCQPRETEWGDLGKYLMACDDEMIPTVIEAMSIAIRECEYTGWQADEQFDQQMSTILREHRISYDFIDGNMIEFSSRELHVSVVSPALKLLAGESKFEKVEKAYQDALEEISRGKPEDAITDAGTALQEMLELLGCKGNALGPLIKSAKSQGLLTGHDTKLADALEAAMSWVSADRSTTGDAHSAAKAEVGDAWLTVHVVGALLLRLADDKKRTQQ